MGWVKRFLAGVGGAKPLEMTLVPFLEAADQEWFGKPFTPDECYVELYVESLRLTRARKFATRFNGVVYTFVTLNREGAAKAELAAVSKPKNLSELDANSLNRVITLSKQMVGSVPWRGGSLGLEVGLVAVKTDNLLTPVVEYVARVSTAAGISFIGAVQPFLPLITEGMDLIAGQQDDIAIEVALDTDMQLRAGCVVALIAAPKGSVDVTKLSLDTIDMKLLLGGQPLNHGYCVLSVRPRLQKADFGEIPELKERYAAIQAAIKDNKAAAAKDALTAFRLATIASPDLITADARRLVEKAEAKVADAFPAGGISKHEQERLAEPLAALDLYS